MDQALHPATSGTWDHKPKYGLAQPTHQADQPAQNGAIASPELPFRTSVGGIEAATKEIRNEHIVRLICLESVVREPCSRAGLERDGSAMAPTHDLVVRSVSAGAALHAWPRSKMASEACGQRRLRNLGAAQAIISESIRELNETS